MRAPPISRHRTSKALASRARCAITSTTTGKMRRPAHLSAYLMWRMNWIHPFFGGNGRTSRAISYLALCAKLGFVLPGTKTIPELIAEDRDPYYKALRLADVEWEKQLLDVSAMEDLISRLLAAQLVQIHEQATGRKAPKS